MSDETDDPEVKWGQGVDPALERFTMCIHGMEPDRHGEFVRAADMQALFTREDAEAIRYVVRAYWLGDPSGYPASLVSIADRIESLLPPE